MDGLLEKIVRVVEEATKADGCHGCAFSGTDEWEMPCSKCKRNCKDYWRPKEDNAG